MSSPSDFLELFRNDPRPDPAGPVAQARIDAIAAATGKPLPPDYVRFLLEFGGGEFRIGRFLSVHERAGGYCEFLERLERSRRWNDLVRVGTLIPFADDWGGNYFCFDMSHGDDDPSVVQLDHEQGADQEPRWQAGSFAEWVQERYAEAPEGD